MKDHNKITVVREYCLARRIPYKFQKEQLTINKEFCCFSVYNIPWSELFQIIDNMVEYDNYGYYLRNKPIPCKVISCIRVNKTDRRIKK